MSKDESIPAYQAQPEPTARAIGTCPSGGDHDFIEKTSLAGYLFAIFLFPCGICCCLFMKEKQCQKCLGKLG